MRNLILSSTLALVLASVVTAQTPAPPPTSPPATKADIARLDKKLDAMRDEFRKGIAELKQDNKEMKERIGKIETRLLVFESCPPRSATIYTQTYGCAAPCDFFFVRELNCYCAYYNGCLCNYSYPRKCWVPIYYY